MFKTNDKMQKLEFATEFLIFSILSRSSTFITTCCLSIFMLCQSDPTVLWVDRSGHSHKKRKDSLEGSPDRVLFAGELEFPKILVPRLPQHTWNINIENVPESQSGQNNCIVYM